MQDRRQIQQIDTQTSQHTYSPQSPAGNSPWLKFNASPHNGSISMQRDDNINGNNKNQQNKVNNIDENDEKDEKDEQEETVRLSSEYSTSFTVFMSAIIILTMVLLIYSNTRDGAFVQIQVSAILPDDNSYTESSLIITENVTPWIASQEILSYTNDHIYLDNNLDDSDCPSDTITNSYQLIAFVKELQAKYPHLKQVNNGNDELDFDYLGKQINITEMLPTGTYKKEVFNFTLTSSIDDFWNAQAYELAFVIAAFSGAWPYIKLLLLLIIWLHPMKQKQRKKGLLILDQLGKYSFIDLYVCIFMVVSFYLVITETMPSGLGIKIAVIVQIDIGVTTFAIATLVSMIYSMLFIYFDEQLRAKKRLNNQSEEKNEIELDDFDCFENKIEKYSPLYEWKHDNSFKIFAFYDLPSSFCGIIWRCLFLVLIIGNIWLCIDTIYTAPVRYDMQGLAGWFVDDNIRSYSIIGTVDKLPSSTDEHAAAWFCVIQYYMTVVIAPILISTVIVCVWLLPMNYKIHNIICHLLYPLQAWSALDVFMVGAIAASVELDQVSQWILDTNYQCVCGDGGIIENIFGTGCFSVKGNLTYGSIMLGCFVVIEWFALLYTRDHINKTHQKLAKNKCQPIPIQYSI